ncbi:MAG: N-glycosylase/DNA lyase [Ignavibacteriae bacterium]|nr:N-glycosylase/DNA lyase [Ignavibacteria bacterium]MBI3364130.1 N-glycosylase/DNA lyase [Ignavibacteriota bacterium]
MKKPLAPITIDELRFLYETKRSAIQSRLSDFARVAPEDYFYELAYCLLTPQSSAFAADKAIRLLRQHDFLHRDLNPEPLLHQTEFYIRFHKTKSQHLLALKEHFPLIFEELTNSSSSQELREWLVKHVKGLGWKESSHFLRNIGRKDMAILDRHILKNLLRVGVIRQLPKTLTPKRYKQLEKKFHTFALHVGIPMDELDLLFWSMETGEIFK